MTHTLPLFDPLEAGAESSGADPGVPGGPAGNRDPRAAQGPSARSTERHLRAAWRLSRGMGRYPEGSAAQTRTGLAICRHLQALLAEAER